MNPGYILILIIAYFALLFGISIFTSKGADSDSFFQSNKNAKWYLVAFGMIGTSLSGVTFISVPGQVGANGFSYLQMVMGYLLGYLVIGTVLMPMYYRLNLVSIYTYLETRFGFWTYKTGAAFFLISRSLGSAARFFLVINVLQFAVFSHFNFPFWLTVLLGIGLIWIYTFQGGLKTIIVTDTLQTFFMISAVVCSFLLIAIDLNFSPTQLVSKISETKMSQIFFWDPNSKDFFFKQFFSGAFIAIVMTGLDQDLMQKNLSCKNIGEAQKNMFWFSIILLLVNALFLLLGAALYLYAASKGIELPSKSDQLFPLLATKYFSLFAGVAFILGIIASTYASTDSALTALTTSFCIDFLNFHTKPESTKAKQKTKVHLAFSLVLFGIVLLFNEFNDTALVTAIFTLAGFTYGPLLGMYAFGLFTKQQVNDKWMPAIAIAAPMVSYVLKVNSKEWLNGYEFGFEILMVNGLITFILMALSQRFNPPAMKTQIEPLNSSRF